MKLAQLKEMTIRFGQINQTIVDSALSKVSNGKEIGKIDGFVIKQANYDDFEIIGLVKGFEPVSFLIYKELDPVELYLVFSKEKQQGHASRLLWFLKDKLKKRILDQGALSDDGLKFITALSKTKRFKINWYNIKTHDQEPFDQSKDKTEFHRKTDWRILIEQSENSLDDPLNMIILFESPAP